MSQFGSWVSIDSIKLIVISESVWQLSLHCDSIKLIVFSESVWQLSLHWLYQAYSNQWVSLAAESPLHHAYCNHTLPSHTPPCPRRSATPSRGTTLKIPPLPPPPPPKSSDGSDESKRTHRHACAVYKSCNPYPSDTTSARTDSTHSQTHRHTRAGTRARAHTHPHTHTHTHTHTHKQWRVTLPAGTHINTHRHKCARAHTPPPPHTQWHARTHTTHAHARSHTHTHTQLVQAVHKRTHDE